MKRACAASYLLLVLAAASADAQENEVSYASTAVAPGLFMLEGVGGFTGGNLGLWTGEDGVVLIDDGMEPYKELMLEAISAHAGAPVDFVINTHVHGDHVGNNAALSMQGATIIAHDNIRARMVADKEGATDKHKLPEVTFSDGVTLHLNGHRARVIHVSHAHTDGDAIIHFPDADVIHTGDILFNGLFPFVDLGSGGSVDGYLAAQARVLALAGAKTRIMSGHGPLATKSDLEAARDMLMDARDRVRSLVAEGRSADEIVALNPLADYHDHWNWAFITTERMTRMLVEDALAQDQP